ncbi:MAG: hypothetical protein R3C56_21520 [Pirellulaceae bacterium]
MIPTLAGDTPDQVATKVAAAVQSVLLSGRLSGLIPIASNDRVSLGDSNMYSVNLNAARRSRALQAAMCSWSSPLQ